VSGESADAEGEMFMLMADTMAIFFVVLGLLLALPGLWLLSLGLWPRAVAESADACSRGLVKPFFAGLPVTLLMIVAAAALNRVPGAVGNISAIAVVCAYMIFAHAGVAGLASCIGRRLASPADRERPWRATLRGSVVLELPFLLPLLGWFVILPAAITIGAGALTMSLLRRAFANSTAAAPVESGVGVPEFRA
jgi:hypothetical protein